MASQEQQQRVKISFSLRTTPPHTISIHDAHPSEPLKLITTIKQFASPFPDHAVTIMTKYSCLETTPGEDAFFTRAMASPQITPPDPQCPAPELPLRPVGKWITIIRNSGDPDMLKRDEGDGFFFLTIPPVGQGHAEVIFELSPERLVRRLGNKDESVEDKLRRLLRPGDIYRIRPSKLSISWWAFGSLEGEDGLSKNKIARWTLPDNLSLVREPGEDETEDVEHKLRDLVDLHDVNKLSSRSAVDDEKRPKIREMRAEGWVFGEPRNGLGVVIADEGKEATFSIVE